MPTEWTDADLLQNRRIDELERRIVGLSKWAAVVDVKLAALETKRDPFEERVAAIERVLVSIKRLLRFKD